MTLKVIVGPMFSGKSSELIRLVKREAYAKKTVGVFKPDIDNRYKKDMVVTHDGSSMPTYVVPTNEEGAKMIHEIVSKGELDVVCIDEIQFFSPEVIELCENLADMKVKVVVAGLNLNFRGEPFDVVSSLLSRADSIKHLTAVCSVCGKAATRSQRLINGMPADYSSPVILVGGKETYEPRCREHHEVKGRPNT